MYFVGIDKARFRRPVEPGDQLILKATLERSLRGIWKFTTVAEVDGQEATSAEMMVAPGTTVTRIAHGDGAGHVVNNKAKRPPMRGPRQ